MRKRLPKRFAMVRRLWVQLNLRTSRARYLLRASTLRFRIFLIALITVVSTIFVISSSQATPSNLVWTINGTSLGYVGTCSAGNYTQTVYNDSTGNYSVAEFTAPAQTGDTQGSCTWTAPSGITSATVVLLGGGGGGGYDAGGGGGGGAFVTGTLNFSSGTQFTLTIGTGGKGATCYTRDAGCGSNAFISSYCPGSYWGQNGKDGNPTKIVGGSYTITALGGGGGGGRCAQGDYGSTIGNSGGNGERCFTSYDASSASYAPYSSCSAPLAQSNYNNGLYHQTFNSGGVNSTYQGAGGGGESASAGVADDASVNSASGANGVSEFLNSPLNPQNASYGGGGGGGTFCSGGHPCPAVTGTTQFAPGCCSSGGGSGGNGGIGDGAASASTTLHTGGGGGGGGGYSAGALNGADGSDGVAFLEWREPLTTSANTVTVNRNATTDGSLSSTGTVALLDAPLYDTSTTTSSCGTFSEAATFTLANATDTNWSVSDTGTASATQIVRGYCYMWTQDSSIANSAAVGASPPSDGSSTAFGNLSSPILILPSRVQVNLPSEILVDPRATSVQFPVTATTSGAGIPKFCFMENDGPTLDNSGYGTAASNQNLSFTTSVIETQTDTTNQTFSTFWDTETKTGQVLSNLTIKTLSPGTFSSPRYLLVRTVPTLYPGFTSDCSSTNPTVTSGTLTPTSKDVYLITILPYNLSMQVDQPSTDLGHH